MIQEDPNTATQPQGTESSLIKCWILQLLFLIGKMKRDAKPIPPSDGVAPAVEAAAVEGVCAVGCLGFGFHRIDHLHSPPISPHKCNENDW